MNTLQQKQMEFQEAVDYFQTNPTPEEDDILAYWNGLDVDVQASIRAELGTFSGNVQRVLKKELGIQNAPLPTLPNTNSGPMEALLGGRRKSSRSSRSSRKRKQSKRRKQRKSRQRKTRRQTQRHGRK